MLRYRGYIVYVTNIPYPGGLPPVADPGVEVRVATPRDVTDACGPPLAVLVGGCVVSLSPYECRAAGRESLQREQHATRT